MSDIFADTVVSFAQSITKAIYGTAEKIPSVLNAVVRKSRSTLSAFEPDTNPRKLDFDLPLDILQDIKHAEVSIGDQICGLENIVLEFHGYGKSYIVSKKLRFVICHASLRMKRTRIYLIFLCDEILLEQPRFVCTNVDIASLLSHVRECRVFLRSCPY